MKRPVSNGEHNADASPAGEAAEKRKRRARRGMKALRDMRKLQASTHNVIPFAPVARLMRETVGVHGPITYVVRTQDGKQTTRSVGASFSAGALRLMHGVIESETTAMLRRAFKATLHAKRIQLRAEDIRLQALMRDEDKSVD